MPELPEVETTRCGISKPLINAHITKIQIRQPQLRWPIPTTIKTTLRSQRCNNITRRSKYLLLHFDKGTLLIHLGMSGRLAILNPAPKPQKHDHVDIHFDNDYCLRYTDPRRFGCILWTKDNPYQHKLLKTLGPEPLTCDFNGETLFRQSRNRKRCVKEFIMDSKIVVGVGNIYASETLFLAGILPTRAAGNISRKRYDLLAECIKQVLKKAIRAGGTTLKDFRKADGKAGYFAQQLNIYGRDNEKCLQCNTLIQKIIIGQRSSFYCKQCQT
ncbi:MAG: bifunctional DNA-formamidopyrimidine glycosylase/DNA-(apurinic or apyrimidinic site) lyase [Gammaproteobacteria bacterium]|nr:bifunctional DNA-formamidopyrimidine glycosylase/DNA-(apurinic or apyrimidinic site) lyase [Gammaproteobacteria bacterium]